MRNVTPSALAEIIPLLQDLGFDADVLAAKDTENEVEIFDRWQNRARPIVAPTICNCFVLPDAA